MVTGEQEAASWLRALTPVPGASTPAPRGQEAGRQSREVLSIRTRVQGSPSPANLLHRNDEEPSTGLHEVKNLCHRLQGVCMVAGGAQAWPGTGPPTYRPWTSISSIGFFFEPTVFTDVEDHMSIAKEESFGPVMIISRFADG